MPKRHRCRTRVSLPHRTKCSAHPCQCQRQVKHGSCATYYWRRYGYATPVKHIPEKRIAFCKEARFPLYLLQKCTPRQTIVGFHVRLLRMARLPAKGGFLRPYRWGSYYRHKAAALQRATLTPAQSVRRLTLKGAAYENASCRLTKSVGGVSASLSSGIFGVAFPVVPQFLSGLFRPAFTEGGDPALLPPVGIKPNTALATAHQRRHINWKSLGTTSGLCPGALPSCTSDGSSMDYRILFAHIAGCLLPVTC